MTRPDLDVVLDQFAATNERYTVDGGKVARVELFGSPEAALEAARARVARRMP